MARFTPAPMRARLALLAVLASTATALAHPPPPPEEEATPRRARLEWSSWLRVAYGSAPAPTTAAARVVGPVDPGADRDHGWEVALGADATVDIGADGDLRLGPWVELRTSSDAMIGGELQITGLPRKLDMFWYEGRGVLALRAGGNRDLATAAIAYGYQAPWDLMHPRHGATRYMIGVRVVATATQAIDDPRIWSATLGVETEPVGALRYLLGVRSWY